jgi:hypothetical protein
MFSERVADEAELLRFVRFAVEGAEERAASAERTG